VSLFGRLLSLTRSNDRLPEEDFLTEIVADLLDRHPDLLERWVGVTCPQEWYHELS
jgi:hypothetical protein